MTGAGERRADHVRSVPAYAGEPPPSPGGKRCAWVYPRLRGGTDLQRLVLAQPQGLSPPTRGNRCQRAAGGAGDGSIPAYAGEPDAVVVESNRDEVYPRLRGGTSVKKFPTCLLMKLMKRSIDFLVDEHRRRRQAYRMGQVQ